jgi:hypothetical protein
MGHVPCSRRLVICVFAGALACHSVEPDASIRSQRLAPGLVGRVGPLSIPGSMVEGSARATRVGADQALQRIVQDALFALEARATLTRGETDAIEATVLARVMLEDIQGKTRALGLPSDEEVAAATRRRWVELDRPPSSRTTHAVALIKRPEQRAEAREVAERIARATRGARDADDFMRRARAVYPGAIQVVAESLPPITEDGRAVPAAGDTGDAPRTFDPRFARACNAIAQPGEQSDVVESDFGWHVIRLEERLPALRVSVDERRRVVAEEVYRGRASREREQLLKALRTRTPVVVTRNATELTGLLKASP